jgi:hypothetical protein
MRLPADLASDEAQTLCFLRDEVYAADEPTAALIGDLRFEHLDRAVDTSANASSPTLLWHRHTVLRGRSAVLGGEEVRCERDG